MTELELLTTIAECLISIKACVKAITIILVLILLFKS